MEITKATKWAFTYRAIPLQTVNLHVAIVGKVAITWWTKR